jgi:triacylglycerol lipase
MTPVGLVKPIAPSAEPVERPPVAELELQLGEAHASGNRLWLRGRVVVPPSLSEGAHKNSSWWERWWWKSETESAPSIAQLETRIGGHVMEASVPLQADGRFEAMFETTLPHARRGWRIARNRLTLAGQTVEKCCAVLTPPENTRGVVIVLLPLAYTTVPGGAQRLTMCEESARLAPILRRLQQGQGGQHAFYYLACTPPSVAESQAEFALAVTTLGWPHGHWVLLPGGFDGALDAFSEGLDRLRWLFAGSFPLQVLNREPAVRTLLPARLQSKPGRAEIGQFVNPSDDSGKLLGQRPPQPLGTSPGSLRRARARLVPRYPVVFCHGMLAFSTLHMRLPEDLNCFRPLRQFLRERGYRALFPQVAPTGGVAARAAQLREQILRWTDEPINLIAHSMGGLDARYLITHLDMADRVRSLTTIATPHRGTMLVDWFLANYRNRLPLLPALETLGANFDGFQDCRPSACQAFNLSTPDSPGVRYFSFGGSVPVTHVSPVLRRAWNLLTAAEGPNDGMVSQASARWGDYVGTIRADHFAQTPDMTFVRPGETFDALGFYCRLVEDLARRAF